MEVSARPARTADVPLVAEQVARSRDTIAEQRGGVLFCAREALPLDAEALRALLDDPAWLVAVGLIDDTVLGHAIVHVEALRDGSRLARVDDLYVEPEAREVGVGEAVMDLVLAWAAGEGCRGVDATALPGDRTTKNFFERFGLVARAIVVHRPLGGSGDP
jgi:GNAT superfamily N-acetyltransferase